MNMKLHAIRQVHGVDATTRFEKGPVIHLSYGSIKYISEQPYPETIVDYEGKFYSEVGLDNGHVLTAFEEPNIILEMMVQAEKDQMEQWRKEYDEAMLESDGS